MGAGPGGRFDIGPGIRVPEEADMPRMPAVDCELNMTPMIDLYFRLGQVSGPSKCPNRKYSST